jgi:hypothetical protein
VAQQLKLATAQQKLASRVDEFNREFSRYIPINQHGDNAFDDCNDLESSGTEHSSEEDHLDLTYGESLIETMFLNLPSELGIKRCKSLGIKKLAKQELRLRRRQSNDILHQLRVELGYKAFIY